ncbi:MAG: tRNA pseudouridine(38-40) synthase TruA, partial [Spirochaetales bacterium]|nr:tRNA pseudouridine(38-40) synthase TruA [Spirochaetales bacterium]
RMIGDRNVDVIGSGRTDSGVHAYGQVAHVEFDTCDIPVKAFHMGLNALLPYSIRIRRSWDVDNSFHARYSAMAREYRYFCRCGEPHDSFSDGLVTVLREFPDIDLLNSYAAYIVGTHDFTTFACSKDICPSKVRDIYEAEFGWKESMYGDKLLCFRIAGNAFLYHMVRSLMGTMLDLAADNKPASAFKELLDAKDRLRTGRTAPSDGLYLWRVSYDPDEYMWFEEKYGRK